LKQKYIAAKINKEHAISYSSKHLKYTYRHTQNYHSIFIVVVNVDAI